MKIISGFVILSGLMSLPFYQAWGQDKKSEEKIIIVIDDGSGPKTLIDTLISGSSRPDSITLKNGKIIVLDKSGKILQSDSDEGNMIVTVTSPDEGEKSIEKTVVIRKGKSHGEKVEKNVEVYIGSDEEGDENKTRFVMAKNGLVVTVEGKDEAQVEAFRKKIEDLLDGSQEKGSVRESDRQEKPGKK